MMVILSPLRSMFFSLNSLKSMYAFIFASMGMAIFLSANGTFRSKALLISCPFSRKASSCIIILCTLYSAVYNLEHFCTCIINIGTVSMPWARVVGAGSLSWLLHFVVVTSSNNSTKTLQQAIIIGFFFLIIIIFFCKSIKNPYILYNP